MQIFFLASRRVVVVSWPVLWFGLALPRGPFSAQNQKKDGGGESEEEGGEVEVRKARVGMVRLRMEKSDQKQAQTGESSGSRTSWQDRT